MNQLSVNELRQTIFWLVLQPASADDEDVIRVDYADGTGGCCLLKGPELEKRVTDVQSVSCCKTPIRRQIEKLFPVSAKANQP